MLHRLLLQNPVLKSQSHYYFSGIDATEASVKNDDGDEFQELELEEITPEEVVEKNALPSVIEWDKNEQRIRFYVTNGNSPDKYGEQDLYKASRKMLLAAGVKLRQLDSHHKLVLDFSK